MNIFKSYWQTLDRGRQDRFRKQHWLALSKLMRRFSDLDLGTTPDDILQDVMNMLLVEGPSGEYEPKPIDDTPERYFTRCIRIRLKAAVRKPLRDKRNQRTAVELDDAALAQIDPTHVDPLESSGHAALEDISEREFQIARLKAALDQTKTGATARRFLDRLTHYVDQGYDTEAIAKDLGVAAETVRSIRLRLKAIAERTPPMPPASHVQTKH